MKSGLGLLLAAEGLGGLSGALLIATLAPRVVRLGVIYMVGSAVAGAGLLLLSFQANYPGALAALLLMGLGLAGFSTMQAAIVIVNTSDDLRGKALGVVTLAVGAGPLGALIVGALANTLGPQMAIRIDAIAALVVVGALFILVPQFNSRMSGHRSTKTIDPHVDPPTRTPV